MSFLTSNHINVNSLSIFLYGCQIAEAGDQPPSITCIHAQTHTHAHFNPFELIQLWHIRLIKYSLNLLYGTCIEVALWDWSIGMGIGGASEQATRQKSLTNNYCNDAAPCICITCALCGARAVRVCSMICIMEKANTHVIECFESLCHVYLYVLRKNLSNINWYGRTHAPQGHT